MSQGSATARQLLALEDRDNLPVATALTEKLVSNLTRYAPTDMLLPEAMDRRAFLQQSQWEIHLARGWRPS